MARRLGLALATFSLSLSLLNSPAHAMLNGGGQATSSKFLWSVAAGLFLTVKTALESYGFSEVLAQFQSIDDTQDKLAEISSSECTPVCESNVALNNVGLKKAKIASGATMGFGALSIASNVGVGGAMLFGVAPIEAALFTVIPSGVTFIASLFSNGYLWNLDINYQDGLPKENTDALKESESKGIYPLVSNGIFGLPGAVALCWMRLNAR
jgi:hypothetical protein